MKKRDGGRPGIEPSTQGTVRASDSVLTATEALFTRVEPSGVDLWLKPGGMDGGRSPGSEAHFKEKTG